MEGDIRWKQRLEHYESAVAQLTRFLEKDELNEFEELGLIQCFEFTYELAWKLMKDYLTYQGIAGITGSRDAVRQAFSFGLISEGEIWMKMIDDRIRTVHTYNESLVEEIEQKIKNRYYELFLDFLEKMQSLK